MDDDGPKIAWGAKVSPAFKKRVLQMGDNLGLDPNYLMACMALATGNTFNPNTYSAVGVGLLPFHPQTVAVLGTTTETLAAMTPVQQLEYVERYFEPQAIRLKTLSDIYMAILWPRAVGKPEDYVLYTQNDNKITKAEAAANVQQALEQGLEYVG